MTIGPDPTSHPDPPPLPAPVRRTGITVTLSQLILGLIAFPALFVGLSLVWGVVSMGDFGRDWAVPVAFTAYGAATMVAFVADRRRWRWAAAAALASQLPWIVGMMWAYFTVYPDGSFLIAAGLAAAACAPIVLAWVAGRRTIPA